VVTVDDQPGDQVVPTEGDADGSGLAWQQRCHRIAEVGDAAGTGLDGGGHLGCAGGGVPDRDDDPACDQPLDHLERTGQLRRDRCHRYSGLA
jgi:hypothetical protein